MGFTASNAAAKSKLPSGRPAAFKKGRSQVRSPKNVIFFFVSAAIYVLAAYVFGTFDRWLGLVMLAVFAARSKGVSTVVLTGNLTAISSIRDVFLNNDEKFGIHFLIPELSQYGPVIGAALTGASEFETES